MKKVKITVLKKHFYENLADAYLTKGRDVGPCPLLEEGDTFLFEGSAVMPQGSPGLGLIFTTESAQYRQAPHMLRGITEMACKYFAAQMEFVRSFF